MGQLVTTIVFDVLGPILLMIGLGALLRSRFELDLATLSKFNIYLITPAFIFDKVSNSTLSWAAMGGVAGITILQVLLLGLIVYGIGRAFRVSRPTLAAIALAVMFYNSGNYGLPLAELAYPGTAEERVLSAESESDVTPTPHSAPGTQHSVKDGGAVQAFVLMTQNLLTYTVGLLIAGMAHRGLTRESFTRVLKLPFLPMLAAGLLARWWLNQDPANQLPIFISKTAGYLSGGLVPTALVTLGVQLAASPRWPRWKPVSVVLVLRLLVAPVLMTATLWGFHLLGVPALDLWPWPAELVILTSSVPTAIGTLLLTLELEGDTDLAADCVFWTTVLSAVTITLWLAALRIGFGS